MEKYRKVFRKDYEKWYQENQEYRERVASDPRRLRFHLMPETGWLNDPNGLCQMDGLYHIYYQYTPFEPTGGIKLWGHYTTTDFVRYTNEEPVLFPDTDLDAHGVYSGSAFVEDGTIHYFYTGNVKRFDRDDYDYIMDGRESNTISFDSRDGFRFTEKKLLLGNEDYPGDMSCHIRDPKIFKRGRMYYMALGARDAHGKGLVLLYESPDLRSWKYHGRITTKETFGYMWECPDLFELDGQLCLICCPQGVEPNGVDYWNVHQCTVMGLDHGLDDDICRNIPLDAAAMVDRGFDFYAPQSFLDESGRRILIGWMGIPDADYTNPTTQAGWQHALTIPRVLHWKEGRLVQEPVRELQQMRCNERTFALGQLNAAGEDGIVFEGCFHFESCGHMRLTVSPGVGVGAEDGRLCLAVGNAGSGRTKRCVRLEELRELQIFSDTSSLEIFVNQGREVFTTRVYGLEGKIRLEGECTGTAVLYDLSGFIYQ